MLGLRLDDRGRERDRPLTVLAIGAHADDIEIGCGGTLLRLAEAHPDASIWWIVLSGDSERADEARSSAADFTAGFGSTNVVVQGFRDSFLPYQGGAVKEFFEELKPQLRPDVIFTHRSADLHQDHRLACELTWNTFRDHLILEYEIPKFDGDMTPANVFSPLSEPVARRKIELVMDHFATQRDRRWFTEDLFSAALRLRGMEANSPSGLAEAFACRKVVLAT
jgi:LmbE family N-acetylglucosaminyl deacetylase